MPNEIVSLSSALEDTLKDSNLQDVTIELAETFTDELLQEGLLRDIPIFGTLVGLTRATINLRDKLFIKKLIYFLSELKDVNSEKRKKIISKIDNSGKERIKIGEKLIYIIDRCDDHYYARYISILFKSFLKKQLTYSDFKKSAKAIQNLFLEDFEFFIKLTIEQIEYGDSSEIADLQEKLISVGFCSSYIEPITVEDEDDYEMERKYRVDGGERIIKLTDLGEKLKKVLKEKL